MALWVHGLISFLKRILVFVKGLFDFLEVKSHEIICSSYKGKGNKIIGLILSCLSILNAASFCMYNNKMLMLLSKYE